jgi:hypothetical protein
VRLGESVRVALMLRSSGNLWVLASPYAEALGSAELFPQRPELVLERGPQLLLRRHFVYDLVPREPGSLHVPELSIPYFDPEAGRYALAQSPAVTIRVQRRAPVAPAAESAAPATAEDVRASDSRSATGIAAELAAVLAVVVAGAGWLIRRRRRRTPSEAVAALREARGIGSPHEAAPALERALRAALARHVPDAHSVTPEELVAREGLAPAVRAAAHQLVAVTRSRFDPQAPAPDPDAVARAVAAL